MTAPRCPDPYIVVGFGFGKYNIATEMLRELVLADLKRTQRLKRMVDDDIDPQFRIATPEGDWAIAVTLPADSTHRATMFELVSDWMWHHSAFAFTLATELLNPPALVCIGISIHEVVGVMSALPSRATRFGRPVWLGTDQIDPVLVQLLPRGSRELTQERIDEIDKVFGLGGPYPAIKLGAER